VALGLAVALTPTPGLQMLIALVLASTIGASRLAAVGAVWFMNPLTALPIYYLDWQVGQGLLDTAVWLADRVQGAGPASQVGAPSLAQLGALELDSWWALGGYIEQRSREIWLGSVLLGLCLAPVVERLLRRWLERHRARWV